MEMALEKCTIVVLAICALHNFLMTRKTTYAPSTEFDRDIEGDFQPGACRDELRENTLQSITASNPGRSSDSANEIRERFKTYFNTDGAVEWQYTAALGEK